jgi:choline dehydrogenase-like flavoprotein
MNNWAYIIIGAGSAGCALAGQLAKSGRNKVLILEAGKNDRSPFIKVPAGQFKAMQSNDWGYHSQPDPSRNNRSESWGRGKVLGGSSSINGTMFVRGAAHDLDRWASMGNEGWSAEQVLPLFSEMEKSDQRHSLRGNNGPLWVRSVKRPHPLTDAFVNAAVAAGHDFNEDYNAHTQSGVAYAQLSQKKGLRCSAADAFLKPLLGRPNVELRLNTLVHKIHLENGRATGVTFSADGKLYTVPAQRVILCAGAIASPQLLMLSGIGDAAELAKHGIQTQIHLPGVGKNLQEHPLLRLTYKTRVPSNNLTEGITQILSIAKQYLFSHEGPISNLFEATAFLKTSAAQRYPDIQLHFVTVGMTTPEDTASDPLLNYPAVTVLLNKSYPLSRGRIRLASHLPDSAPLIECRLLENDADIETLTKGIWLVRNIMSAAPLKNWVDNEIKPGVDLTHNEQLRNYIRRNTELAYHPVGTCRMGIDSDAVVTPQLHVKGVDNLFVADASIMPDLISGNTNAVCMMIGFKLGKELMADNK